MFRSADLLAWMRGGYGFGRRKNEVDAAVEGTETAAVGMWRYLPLAMLATGSVVVLPGALVAAVVPWGGALWALACAALAMALAIVLASAEATLWARQPWSRDLVFADLMLWGWLRRCWTERRLARARELYDSARRAGPTVSIESAATFEQAARSTRRLHPRPQPEGRAPRGAHRTRDAPLPDRDRQDPHGRHGP